MNVVSVETAQKNIETYLRNDIAAPFFVVVDDAAEYQELIEKFDYLSKKRVSDYCIHEDCFPNMDSLREKLSQESSRVLLLGVGEYVTLSNNNRILGELKDLTLASGAKLVILCRNCRSAITDYCLRDSKFNSRRTCFLKSGDAFHVLRFPTSLPLSTSCAVGFQALLARLEDGAKGNVFVKSDMHMQRVTENSSVFAAVLHVHPGFPVSQDCLPDELWEEFLADDSLNGNDFRHWRTFLRWKWDPALNDDAYIAYVLENSRTFAEYQKNLVSALLSIPVKDSRFKTFYARRKELLKGYKDSDISGYVRLAQKKDHRLHYLTDNTSVERQAILESLKEMTEIPKVIQDVYPALWAYLCDYSFQDATLTRYFSDYKRLKVTNRVSEEFLECVQQLAVDGNRPYNSLPTRGEILDRLNQTKTMLIWVDALGVEYLGYIQSLAKRFELGIRIHIVRANLPTITSLNKDFFDTWHGAKENKIEILDKLKHGSERILNADGSDSAAYIERELAILDSILENIKTKLESQKASKILLVSDHGASRLAVIRKQECKWKMAEHGVHSGRCCKCSEIDEKPESATRENDFWVFANYDRFQGSRKADVEVHGGASLEEVVIPVIEFTLMENTPEIEILTPVISANYRNCAEIELFCINHLHNVSVRLGDQFYCAAPNPQNPNKYHVSFTGIYKPGQYAADVFEGDNLLGSVAFEIESKMGKSSDLF